MKISKIYIALLLAAFTLNTAAAQDKTSLNKEITLEKDVAPIEKKAPKKNALPKVKKATVPKSQNPLGYSDLTAPINVPNSVPTMLPYGYRTAHNFNDKRGYLDAGIGTQANFAVDFGYRILESERESLKVWLNHNSTWAGENSSKAVTLDENRNKQKFNDNTLGVDYSKTIDAGTLTMGIRGHIDSYNMYGGWNCDPVAFSDPYVTGQPDPMAPYCDWDSEKQTFSDVQASAAWASRFTLMDRLLRYNAGVTYGYAGYDQAYDDRFKHGSHDNWGIIDLGAACDINELTTAALTVKGEYLRRGTKSRMTGAEDLFDEVGMITITPTYTVRRDLFTLQLGLNAHVNFSDGAAFQLSPNVRFDLNLAHGFSAFANVLGGRGLGYRVNAHYANCRYDSPLLMYGSVFTPLDAEAGFKVGPIQGLSGKLSLGYAIVKDQPGILYRGCSYSYLQPQALGKGMMSTYMVMDGRGYYVNAEVAYKYRSLLEVKASLTYAPHDDELFETDKHYNGYKLGVDRASTVASVDVTVNPIRRLSLDLGLEYRGGRMALFGNPLIAMTDFGMAAQNPDYSYLNNGDYLFVDMDDAINLHAGATYRLSSTLGVWAQAHNLLNRRYDILYGMGAQRIGVMAGVSLSF